MTKNKTVLVLITILIAVVIIAISVALHLYNKNKEVIPDVKYIDAMSSNDAMKIKAKYELNESKEQFLELCGDIELAVTNKFLDGTVTNDDELKAAINNINNMFKTDNWSYLGLEYPSFWMGVWQLDSTGMLKFSFSEDSIKPSWVQDEDIKKYIK